MSHLTRHFFLVASSLVCTELLVLMPSVSTLSQGEPTATGVAPAQVRYQIVDQQDVKTVVMQPKVHYYQDCKGVIYYTNVATEVNFYWDYLQVNTGDFVVEVPLEIVRNVVFEPLERKDQYSPSRSSITVSLLDDTVLTGETPAYYELTGEADLGDFKLNIANLKEITAVDISNSSFAATLLGSHQLTLNLSGGNTLKLESASFYVVKRNRNGCLVGKDYPEKLAFQTGASEYDVTWDKIKGIVPLPQPSRATQIARKADEPVPDEFVLTTQSGSEYSGRSRAIDGVTGIATFGDFKLKVEVDFTNTHASISFAE